MAVTKRTASVVTLQRNAARKIGPVPAKKHTWPLYTLDEAFYPGVAVKPENDPRNARLDLEKSIRSVAYLLHILSDCGNCRVDGFTAEGLASALDHCAAQIGFEAGRNRNPFRPAHQEPDR